MRDVDQCGLPYVRNGDITDCRLRFNHDNDCEQANHAAFIASLHERTRQALNDPWL